MPDVPRMADLDDDGLFRYFDDQRSHSNPEFWRRMGFSPPDLDGMRVIDLGSGVGAMSVELAEHGATVLGIELHEERVAFAQRLVEERYPALRHLIEFRNAQLESICERDVDLVVSKDTFEHVADMKEMLAFLATVLRQGGQVWTGFSPMWCSPNGDHGLTGSRLPWAHVVLPRRRVLRLMSQKVGRDVTSLEDVDLNGMRPAEFRSYVSNAGFVLDGVRYNAGDKIGLRVMNLARQLPGLEPYFTAGIYCVLRKS